jgi:DNA topoisomerase-1
MMVTGSRRTHPEHPRSSLHLRHEPAHRLRVPRQTRGLVGVGDDQPGIRRRRAGSGFVYLAATGRRIHDPRELRRIRSLAVPPAWRDVWICPTRYGYLQATGLDARGRKQYRYHPEWRAAQDAQKFARMAAFAAALPRLRRRVDRDMRDRGLSRCRVLATVVRLLDETLIRVGNREYARENKSYGLTTLLNKHVAVSGGVLRFHFRAKSGTECCLSLSDRRTAQVVRCCQELPGRVLFEYVDEEGRPRTVDSGDVNAYLREVMGPLMTAKDFRTWGGSVAALERLLELGPAESATQAKRNIVGAVKCAAERLGNTPAVCRSSYIHPAVIAAYEQGALPARTESHPGERTPVGLSAVEGRLLRLLRSDAHAR